MYSKSNPEEIQSFLSHASFITGGYADRVVLPESIEEVSEALAAANRWEILFLTQRPTTAGDTAQVQSQRWLRAQGFDMPSVFVMNGSRGKLAAALHLDAARKNS